MTENDLIALIQGVIDNDSKPKTPWDEYVPIIETDELLSVYLTDAISHPSLYNEAATKIATSKVPVTIVLNTPGGLSSTAFMFAAAMKKCQQPIHGVITGDVASAGTIITMHCDTIEVQDYAQFMIHNYSHGAQGSGAQVKEYVNFTDREFTRAASIIYAGFLTEDELFSVSSQDKEIWLNKDEVLERWARKTSYEA